MIMSPYSTYDCPMTRSTGNSMWFGNCAEVYPFLHHSMRRCQFSPPWFATMSPSSAQWPRWFHFLSNAGLSLSGLSCAKPIDWTTWKLCLASSSNSYTWGKIEHKTTIIYLHCPYRPSFPLVGVSACPRPQTITVCVDILVLIYDHHSHSTELVQGVFKTTRLAGTFALVPCVEGEGVEPGCW